MDDTQTAEANALFTTLEEVAAPLFVIDSASLYLVRATTTEVHLHLAGAYSGCPGNGFVEKALLAPLVKKALPRATLKTTSGFPIPKGARRVTPEAPARASK